jgi:aspartate/tyrosine/aromatic aminotransferase
MAASCIPMFVAISFSKSFALYGERVGALCLVDAEQQAGIAGDRTGSSHYASPAF